MSLQDWFYLVGIIYMIGGILLVFFIAIIFYLVYRKIDGLHDYLTGKIEAIAHPAELAVGIGSGVAKTAIKGVRKIIDREKKNE